MLERPRSLGPGPVSPRTTPFWSRLLAVLLMLPAAWAVGGCDDDGKRVADVPPGTCLCGFPELFCRVDGELGPSCDTAADCSDFCTSGQPTCAPGPGLFPPECEPDGCVFADPTCEGVCLCGFPELFCTQDGQFGPPCGTVDDCGDFCSSGLATCAPGPGLFPPECGEDGCFFVEEICEDPSLAYR